MADAAGRCRTRLSDLSDDLLRHILFFAPAREATSTSVLSRRWRSLWRTSGAVNVDTRSFDRGCSSQQAPRHKQRDAFSAEEREAFLAGAKKALAAAQCTIRRLTFYFAEGSRINLMYRGEAWSEHNLVEAVVSSPAARRVEELHVKADGIDNRCTLSFGSLPSEALRVLRLVKCFLEVAPPAAAFPRLADLLLEECGFSVVDLLRAIDGAPQLSTLHLKSAYIIEEESEETIDRHTVRSYSFRCPEVTDLVFADCKSSWNKISLEVDAPKLRYFRYKGPVQRTNLRLSLKPQSSSSLSVPNLIKVDLQLHLSDDYDAEREVRKPFWQFIQNFNTTKHLKLRLDFSMDRLALVEEESQEELLMGSSLFYLLEWLELEAPYDPKSKASMVVLGNLLSCCPRVASLRLKLSKNEFRRPYEVDKEARLGFDKSIDHFRRHKRRKVSLGAEDDGSYDQASDFPGLSNHSFICLQSYLRRVSLHFCMKETNCLGVQLAKFFAEKAVVLEEMYIDDGSKKLSEHINTSVRMWSIVNSSTRRSLNLAVLPPMNCSTRSS